MDKETSEIAKLTGRISQDPKSKLFVPLAEEYKKAGDLEMAIHVLLEGLKNNPDYVTARSSLGKLLLAKGDLAGAQKEFEEVVKHIPDNPMAQKKLGDLLIVQNRPQDALPRYKIALSQNPNDGELASLISDLEAGRDVSSKIHLTKAKAMAEQAVRQVPPATLSARETASALVPAPVSKVEPPTQIENPPVSQEMSPASFAEAARTPVSSVSDREEPEEVLIVEPLEPEISWPEPPVNGFDLTGEQATEAIPVHAAEERLDDDVSARTHVQDESPVSEDIRHETDLFTFEETETIHPAVPGETAANEIIDAAFADEIMEKVPDVILEEVPEKSDDFTTDTLAELYIAQGFFEKAIEIYERMLADNPSSRGLKDKLERVRASAAQSGALSAGEKKEPAIHAGQEVREYDAFAEAGEIAGEPSIFDELEGSRPTQESETVDVTHEIVPGARGYVPTAVPEEITTSAGDLDAPGEYKPGETSPVEDLFAESREYQPAVETTEQPTAGGAERFDAVTDETAEHEQARPKPHYLDFEPREYIPPQTEQGSPKPSADKVHVTAKAAPVGRNEAIARLETWLTHIKKEK
jgi:tetratricopeptide (TPR) repeat protein